MNAGFGYVPALGPLLSIVTEIFNEPSFIRAKKFYGWTEFVMNVLLLVAALVSIYSALTNSLVVFWIMLVIFIVTSFKNTQSQSMNFAP